MGGVSKDLCSEADLRRFAICFVHAGDFAKDFLSAVDWESAAKDYDPNVKPASFRTVTSKALKKLIAAAKESNVEAGEEGEGDGEGEAKKTTTKPKTKAAAKRKKTEDAEEGDGDVTGDEKQAAKKTKAAKGKGGKKGGKVEVKNESESDGGEADAAGEANGGMGDEAFV